MSWSLLEKYTPKPHQTVVFRPPVNVWRVPLEMRIEPQQLTDAGIWHELVSRSAAAALNYLIRCTPRVADALTVWYTMDSDDGWKIENAYGVDPSRWAFVEQHLKPAWALDLEDIIKEYSR